MDDSELEVPVDDPVEEGVVDDCALLLPSVSVACVLLGFGSDGEGSSGSFGSSESSESSESSGSLDFPELPPYRVSTLM